MRTLGTMAVRKKTYDEALRWFEQAAAAGHELAPGLVRIFSFVSGRGALRALGRESVKPRGRRRQPLLVAGLAS